MEEVIEFAKKKHKGQFRKFSKDPYIIHPIRVANILKNINEKDDVIMAAYLHDTIEDTNTTYEEIKDKFGLIIANLVKELTKNRSEIEKIGKVKYLINKINNMSIDALTIKLADRLDNVMELSKSDQEFKEKYEEETIEILDKLNRKLNPNQKILYNLIMNKLKIS